MVQAPTPVTAGGKERLLTGDSVLEEVNLVGAPLGGSCSLTQRLRGETLGKSKCGSSVKFTESGQDCRVPGTSLQATWDCVLRSPGKRDHSLWSGPHQRSSWLASLKSVEWWVERQCGCWEDSSLGARPTPGRGCGVSDLGPVFEGLGLEFGCLGTEWREEVPVLGGHRGGAAGVMWGPGRAALDGGENREHRRRGEGSPVKGLLPVWLIPSRTPRG